MELQKDTSRHFWGGVIFISVTILSLLITFTESIYEVCFNEEQDDEGFDDQTNYYNQAADAGDVDDNQRQLMTRRLMRLMVGH